VSLPLDTLSLRVPVLSGYIPDRGIIFDAPDPHGWQPDHGDAYVEQRVGGSSRSSGKIMPTAPVSVLLTDTGYVLT
jgi:hypothetical protein